MLEKAGARKTRPAARELARGTHSARPPGTTPALRTSPAWRTALERVLAEPAEHGVGTKMDEVARACYRAAADGNVSAIREIVERIDGKPPANAGVEAPLLVNIRLR